MEGEASFCLHLNCHDDGDDELNSEARARLASQRKDWLASVEAIIWRVLGSQGRAEARLWLCAAIGSLAVPSDLQARIFLDFVKGFAAKTNVKETGKKKDGEVNEEGEDDAEILLRQVLRLACEKQPRRIMRLFAKDTKLIRSFFSGHPKRILWFFEKFSSTGKSNYQLGAQAIARFAFIHRDNCWKELQWKGAHGQAPSTVASKPHYFLDLDVISTVENFLDNVPSFWSSDELWDSLKEGDLLTLDVEFFIDKLYQKMTDGSSATWRMLDVFFSEEGFPVLCQRLLPFFSDKNLLAFINELSLHFSKMDDNRSKQTKHPAGGDRKTTWFKTILSFGEKCHSLNCALLSSACVGHTRELLRIFMDTENVHELESLKCLVIELKKDRVLNDRKHWALLKHESNRWELVKWMALESWSMYFLMTEQCISATSIETLLTENSVEFRHSYVELGHGRSKFRKLETGGVERSKKRKKKKRKKFDEDRLDMCDSGEDYGSMEDGWYLSMDGFSMQIGKVELPEHLSCHAFGEWLKWF